MWGYLIGRVGLFASRHRPPATSPGHPVARRFYAGAGAATSAPRAAGVALAACGAFGLLSAPAAFATTVSFTTAGCTTWTAPAGVTSVQVNAIGAAGAVGLGTGTTPPSAGNGDGVASTVSGISSGQVLDVCVDSGGGAGAGGSSGAGGGGGGASGVSIGTTFGTPLLVAGAGGGTGGGLSAPNGGNAGHPNGSAGGSGTGPSVGATGGSGGTASAGGAAGTSDGGSAPGAGQGFGAGGPGAGGAGGSGSGVLGGGGGGAGYYGGGGGGGESASGPYSSAAGGGGSDVCTNGPVGALSVSGCAFSPGAGTQHVAGSAAGDAQVTLTYTVASPPTASIATPANGATYAKGQVVNSSFTCTEGAGGPGIVSCTDQNGHPSGTAIDTSTVGQHTFTVTATSADGLMGSTSVTYTVASPPTASIATPANGATYAKGQVVNSSFTCTEGAGGPGIGLCTDQNGHPSGTAIDTSTTGSHTFTVTATSADGLTGSSSVTYKVASPPTAAITTPVNGATSGLGQVVHSSFICTEGAGGPGIASCTDQNGHPSGTAIDTSTTGPHTLTVTSTSHDGLTGTSSVTYTVLPLPKVFPGPPLASTTRAVFGGVVNPEGLSTTGHFEYFLDQRYGPVTVHSTRVQHVGSDVARYAVSASVSGLIPNALYHVRLVASSRAGTTYGPDQRFMTKRDKPPASPVLGRSFDAAPVSGIVFIKPPRGRSLGASGDAAAATATPRPGKGFVPLTEARSIPAGSQIDARLGSLLLTTASRRRGKTESGVFGGAVFKVTQDRRGKTKGLTTLSLLEGVVPGSPSYASCKKHRAADRSGPTAQAAAGFLASLRARGRGHFRTRGAYSAGTVRGTAWDTTDRCDGTLTVVHSGTVLVSDFVRHITLAVHAGHRYLARAPGGRAPSGCGFPPALICGAADR